MASLAARVRQERMFWPAADFTKQDRPRIGYMLSSDVKKVAFSKPALKQLRRMPADHSARVQAKIMQYASDPASLGNNVKALRGSPYIRLRVGDWRVIMDDQGAILAILKIGPRGDVYD